jgi:phage terminase large subunit-like protein
MHAKRDQGAGRTVKAIRSPRHEPARISFSEEVVMSELARWSAPALRKTWAALTTGSMGRTGPQVVAISTAGAAHERSEGILGQLIDRNEEHGELELPHTGLSISRNTSARTLCFNYAAPTGTVEDVQALKQANPASWVTADYLAAQAASPELSASEVLQLHGCVWSALDRTWIDAEVWDAAEHRGALRAGEPVAVGFDGARTRDSTCFVAVSLETGHLQLLELWERPQDLRRGADWSVTSTQVNEAFARICKRYRVTRAYCDPALWHSEIEAWDREHRRVKVVKYGGAPSRIGAAVDRFAVDLRQGAIHHDGDPRLRRHVLAAQRQDVRGGALLQKPSRSETEHIDGAQAAIRAWEARADSIANGEDRRAGARLHTF